ncbi:LysR family transcriptional regulator [Allokutzneria albata]|uniref:LysR substrate binding domain-containing protein n=1 Tax=Allokutzneria albata TaxID=211114 RepID=A0A1G9VCA3_ALLAB|nr:LysR family transcriptional regulator [Allokutzneria albata]SDM69687.1 LysR substrate binding domain-containing protein [Allokutzneria albata]
MAPLDGTELRHLRAFLAVVKAGTITGAAEELRIAQPSLSQQIAALERRVGVPLFRRTARGVRPTPAGDALAAAARKAFRVLEGGLDRARSAPAEVVVGLCSGVPEELLHRLRAEIDGELRLEPTDSAAQPGLVRSGTLDLGVVRLPVPVEGLECTVLAEQPLGVVAHRSHPLAAKSTVDWSELEGQRLLWFQEERAPGYANAVLEHAAAEGWSPVLHRTRPGHTLFKYALSSQQDLVALRPDAQDPGLVWIPFTRCAPVERLALIRSCCAARGTRR